MLGKTRLKQLLYGFELRITAIITNGLVHRVPKRIVLAQIKTDLIRSARLIGLNSAEINQLWLDSHSRYIKLSKKVFSSLRKTDLDYKDKLLERQNVVYRQIRTSVLGDLEHQKNDLANDVERRFKQEKLVGLTKEGIFFLCSSHINPAIDHADYEGKIYVSEDWENRCDPNDVSSIRAYIRNRQIRTVEWVIGPPVYMIYRPNCKHYFIRVSVEEVLHNSVKKLLKKHEAYMKDDPPMSYEKTVYKEYYEKLKALLYLREMCPSDELDKDIKTVRRLTVKWGIRAKG